jgi:hypothetical protein
MCFYTPYKKIYNFLIVSQLNLPQTIDTELS